MKQIENIRLFNDETSTCELINVGLGNVPIDISGSSIDLSDVQLRFENEGTELGDSLCSLMEVLHSSNVPSAMAQSVVEKINNHLRF